MHYRRSCASEHPICKQTCEAEHCRKGDMGSNGFSKGTRGFTRNRPANLVHPTGPDAAFAKISVARALQAGLAISTINDTVRDTLAWYLALPEAERALLKAGIDPAREQAVLAAWRKAQNQPVK